MPRIDEVKAKEVATAVFGAKCGKIYGYLLQVIFHILERVEPLHSHLQHVKMAAIMSRRTSVTRRGHVHGTHQSPVQMRVAGIPDDAS